MLRKRRLKRRRVSLTGAAQAMPHLREARKRDDREDLEGGLESFRVGGVAGVPPVLQYREAVQWGAGKAARWAALWAGWKEAQVSASPHSVRPRL
jgi:hypothetical protein